MRPSAQGSRSPGVVDAPTGKAHAVGLSTDLERAIVRCLCERDHHDITCSEVDCNASFFDPTGYRFGSYVLDSLDIVELVVTLEAELGLELVLVDDFTRFDSIAKVSTLARDSADPARRRSFEKKWAR
jgi:acyl carrier protein